MWGIIDVKGHLLAHGHAHRSFVLPISTLKAASESSRLECVRVQRTRAQGLRSNGTGTTCGRCDVTNKLGQRTLTHLRALEAESIYIIREVAAEFDNPVMLYSIGKDSSVMLRLAQKAFAPGTLPFPLLHVDTTYKFRQMVEFRDRYCAEQGLELKVHTNQDAVAQGISPFTHGSGKYTDAFKTQALLQALNPRDISHL